jgi:hypothetical protein
MSAKTQKNLTAKQIQQYRALLPHASSHTQPSVETIGRAISDLQIAAEKTEPWLHARVSVVGVCQYLHNNLAMRHHLREPVEKTLRDLATGKIKKAYASAKLSGLLKNDLETLVSLKLLRRGQQGMGGLFLTPIGSQVFDNWPNLKEAPIRILALQQLLRLVGETPCPK